MVRIVITCDNTHKRISGAPESQQILSYINSPADLHELDCFVFDLSAALAATLATAIVTKTENIFHAILFIPGSKQAAQAATNTLPYNKSNIVIRVWKQLEMLL